MSRPLLVFAHGAGASSASAWMLRWRDQLSSLGDVTTFDYPYMQAKRRRPDPMPVLLGAHRAAIQQATMGRKAPLVLVGKSMGSRVGCHVAAADDEVARKVRALVCLGYPLKGIERGRSPREERSDDEGSLSEAQAKSEAMKRGGGTEPRSRERDRAPIYGGALRDQVLLALDRPILFVQGTRDALCPLDLLKEIQGRMRAPNRLHVVEGGNHSLEVTKTALAKSRKTQADFDGESLGAIGRFLDEVLDA